MAEDRKFKFEDGRFVNRVSGEAIPDDEPVIIFRARDNHALNVLQFYQDLATDMHHKRAIQDRIDEFAAYRAVRPERLKEPGITRHIVLNSELASGMETRRAETLKDGSGRSMTARPEGDAHEQ